MITDLLLLHPVRAWVSLGVTIAVCLAVGVWVVREGPRGRRVAAWLAGLTFLPVLVLTLLPVQRELYAVCVVQFSLPTSLRVGDVLANVVLLVPAAWFAALATRRPVLVAVLGSLTSAGIETVQALVPAIGRSCDTNDWLGNTTGVVGAVLVAALFLGLGDLARRVRRRPVARAARPEDLDPDDLDPGERPPGDGVDEERRRPLPGRRG